MFADGQVGKSGRHTSKGSKDVEKEEESERTQSIATAEEDAEQAIGLIPSPAGTA